MGPRPRGRARRGAIYEYYPRLSLLPLVHVTLLVRPRHGGSWWAPGRGAVLVAMEFVNFVRWSVSVVPFLPRRPKAKFLIIIES